MPMYTRSADGFEPIPTEHEKVLDLYREQLHEMVVWEQDYAGAYPFAALVLDDDPEGTPEASALEYLAESTAARLRAARRGGQGAPLKFEELAKAAAHAYLTDIHDFSSALHAEYGDNPAKFRSVAAKDTEAAARKLTTAVAAMAKTVVANSQGVNV